MAQAPGIQMASYDVGGSRTGTQTGFLTYGFGQQNQTKLEGIDTTEGTDANAGYFDFGSFEEFQVGGAGGGADSFGGGTNMSITVKSGGDKFSGNWYSDWQGDSTISDNVPDAFKVANQPDEDGYFSRTALTRGNPIDRQYDINFNIGGPIWKQKAWFFASYRLNDQYKYTLGIDTLARSKLTNPYTLKGTFQLNRNNQIIGFLQQAQQAAGAARPRPARPDLGGPLPGLAQLPVEGRVDQRARQPRVPRRDWRQLVQLLPARADRCSTASSTTSAPAASTPRPTSGPVTTTPTRTRSATSRRSTSTCRTSRTAWPAATTSRSATTGSATRSSSRGRSRAATSSIATPTAR